MSLILDLKNGIGYSEVDWVRGQGVVGVEKEGDGPSHTRPIRLNVRQRVYVVRTRETT